MLLRLGTRWPVHAKVVKHNGDVSLIILTPVRPQDASLMHNEQGRRCWEVLGIEQKSLRQKEQETRQNRVNASCPTSLFPDPIVSADMVPL